MIGFMQQINPEKKVDYGDERDKKNTLGYIHSPL